MKKSILYRVKNSAGKYLNYHYSIDQSLNVPRMKQEPCWEEPGKEEVWRGYRSAIRVAKEVDGIVEKCEVIPIRD